jgi:alkylhydroperoxidase family enzyme
MTAFVDTPEPGAAGQRLFDDDLKTIGFVMNASRLWAYQPATLDAIFDVMRQALSVCPLTMRERGILVAAGASTLGDAYCSLAWGCKLAEASDAQTAAGVLSGDDGGLTSSEQALARWARKVTGDPNGTSPADVQQLRDAGYRDEQIFAITVYVAMRIAFATVNDALGARPDAEYRDKAPDAVLKAITFGRAIADP